MTNINYKCIYVASMLVTYINIPIYILSLYMTIIFQNVLLLQTQINTYYIIFKNFQLPFFIRSLLFIFPHDS